VQTDKTKESVVEFANEMKNLAGAKPISQAELTSAQQGRVRGYYDSNDELALAQLRQDIARLADEAPR